MLREEAPTLEELNEIPYHQRFIKYVCQNCGSEYYEVISKKDRARRCKCPNCNKSELESIVENPMGFVRQDAKTVAQLADRNTSNMGQYELQDKRREAKTRYKQSLAEKLGREESELNNLTSEDSVFKDQDKKKKVMKLTPEQKGQYLRGEIDV